MAHMTYRVLGSSGIKVSALSLGTMMLGGATDEREAQLMVDHAADNGVNFIDTADVYADGRSETIVGATIRPKREHWVLATKVGQRGGARVTDFGLSRRYLLRSSAETSVIRASALRLRARHSQGGTPRRADGVHRAAHVGREGRDRGDGRLRRHLREPERLALGAPGAELSVGAAMRPPRVESISVQPGSSSCAGSARPSCRAPIPARRRCGSGSRPRRARRSLPSAPARAARTSGSCRSEG